MDEYSEGPGSETLSRQLKEDSSTGLHGITNGGTVLITGKIGQTYTASTHVKLESGGRTQAYVGIGQDGNGTELGAVYKVFDISGGTLVSGTKPQVVPSLLQVRPPLLLSERMVGTG